MPRMNLALTGVVFTDLLLADVGVLAFQLEHDWWIQEELTITTAPGGGGTVLSEGVDYILGTESADDAVKDTAGLSTRVSAAVGAARHVYKTITVINAAYQTGDLYFSGKYVADDADAEDQLPPGVILPYGAGAAPPGWLLCHGWAVSRWTHRRLFAVIGTRFGVGNGTTTFNLPDMRGVSPVGVGSQDIGGRTKTGPALGEVREDTFQGHWHVPIVAATTGGVIKAWASGAVTSAANTLTEHEGVRQAATDGVNGPPRPWPYTHGPELGVNFIIKT